MSLKMEDQFKKCIFIYNTVENEFKNQVDLDIDNWVSE